METFDYSAMAAELVRAIRGKRTQRFLGRKVGFSSNVLYSWEAGRSHPVASAFFRLAFIGNGGLPSRINRFTSSHSPALDARVLATAEGIALLMRELAADEPIAALARDVGADRTTMTRWLSGRTEPRLPDFLGFVQQRTHRVLQFVELFADPMQLPSTAVGYRSVLAQQRLASDLPMSHAVLRALELKSYGRVQVGKQLEFIARQTGLSTSDVQSLLDALREADLIERCEGKWHVKDVMTIDTRNTIERDVDLKRLWLDVARSRLDAARLTKTSLFSYNLFAVSEHGYEQIRALHLDYYERVRRIVASDSGPQRVVLACSQLVPLDE